MKKAAACILVLGLGLISVAMADDPVMQVNRNRSEVDRIAVKMQMLRSVYTAGELEEGVYVGDEFCIACHQWATITRDVKHRKALRTPMGVNTLIAGKGVVADYDENGVDDFMQGLDFNTISSVFDPYKPNAPVLSYNGADDTYWITIGPLTVQVWITQGGTGDWKQRYLTRIPATGVGGGWAKDNYVSPIQFNEKTHGYVLYHPEHWWDPDTFAPILPASPTIAQVVATGRSYSKRCIGCHTTGTRELGQDANGEWIYRPYVASLVYPDNVEQYPDYDHDGIPDIVNIGCEACHGPGSLHVLGGGDPAEILAPSGLDTDAANALCQQCHVRVKSVPTGVHDWQYDETTGKSWIPGRTAEPLESFYTLADGRWPDGKNAKQHHQQWHDLYESPKPTSLDEMVKCVDCHSPHKGGEHMLVTSIEEDGVVIPTENDNNTLCLACHSTEGDFADITKAQVADLDNNLDHISTVVEAHSNHPYAPTRRMGLSRCSKCHMANVAKSAVNYDIHSHTFEAIPPEKTLMYQPDGGMPNSCAASCHAVKVDSFDLGMDPDIGVWNAQHDVDLATMLEEYFGPGGTWWDTTVPASATRRILNKTARPDRYDPTADPDDD